MASSSDFLAGMQRRAAENPDVGISAFHTYPWQQDRIFLTQLSTTLKDFTHEKLLEPGVAQQIVQQTQVERFQKQTGISIEAEGYQRWLSRTQQKPARIVSQQLLAQEVMSTPNVSDRKLTIAAAALGDELAQHALEVPTPGTTGPTSSQPTAASSSAEATASSEEPQASVPSWQSSAPTAPLFVKKDGGDKDGSGGDKEPYPAKFEQIVAFLQTGQEIPGIRKIPDTVVEDPSISTTGKMAAPPKPWEKKA
ncbi:hypothetical protein F4780DRAFT_742425 [Xylariomycetidae sp. FL0641]|nr:hypothetical protein F4780DRAFT_742425 [Xylariomycetidae sp. FL0641]